MKIKTITCHNVYNYGATLQAYALQTYLETLGHQVEIIDYYPKYRNKRNFWKIPNNSKVGKYSKRYFLFHLLYAIHRAIKYYRDTNFDRSKKFDEFDRKYLHITSKKYTSYQQLKDNPPIADCYIAGSDQIWNSQGDTGKDPAFFLNFGDSHIKRISYAASFGISEIEEPFKPQLKKYLSTFNAISVREKTGLDILTDLGYKEAIQVCDPVFLLSKEDWLKIASPSLVEGDYILVYDFFQDDKCIREMAINLSRERNYKIVAVNDGGKCKYADINICDASPNAFLSLIYNADVVVSNSFHATAFSLILETNFYTYPVVRNKNQSRMIDLLDGFGLLDRFNVNVSKKNNSVDFSVVKRFVLKIKEQGCNYLAVIDN